MFTLDSAITFAYSDLRSFSMFSSEKINILQNQVLKFPHNICI